MESADAALKELGLNWKELEEIATWLSNSTTFLSADGRCDLLREAGEQGEALRAGWSWLSMARAARWLASLSSGRAYAWGMAGDQLRGEEQELTGDDLITEQAQACMGNTWGGMCPPMIDKRRLIEPMGISSAWRSGPRLMDGQQRTWEDQFHKEEDWLDGAPRPRGPGAMQTTFAAMQLMQLLEPKQVIRLEDSMRILLLEGQGPQLTGKMIHSYTSDSSYAGRMRARGWEIRDGARSNGIYHSRTTRPQWKVNEEFSEKIVNPWRGACSIPSWRPGRNDQLSPASLLSQLLAMTATTGEDRHDRGEWPYRNTFEGGLAHHEQAISRLLWIPSEGSAQEGWSERAWGRFDEVAARIAAIDPELSRRLIKAVERDWRSDLQRAEQSLDPSSERWLTRAARDALDQPSLPGPGNTPPELLPTVSREERGLAEAKMSLSNSLEGPTLAQLGVLLPEHQQLVAKGKKPPAWAIEMIHTSGHPVAELLDDPGFSLDSHAERERFRRWLQKSHSKRSHMLLHLGRSSNILDLIEMKLLLPEEPEKNGNARIANIIAERLYLEPVTGEASKLAEKRGLQNSPKPDLASFQQVVTDHMILHQLWERQDVPHIGGVGDKNSLRKWLPKAPDKSPEMLASAIHNEPEHAAEIMELYPKILDAMIKTELLMVSSSWRAEINQKLQAMLGRACRSGRIKITTSELLEK